MPTLWHQLQLIFLIQSSHLNRNSGIRINLEEDSTWIPVCETLTPPGWGYCARLASSRLCKSADYSSWWQFCCSLSILTVLFFCLFGIFSFFFYFTFQVSECNWPSRQAPSLHNLFAVCKNMHNWLKQNPKNVCVTTCSVRKKKKNLMWHTFITFSPLSPFSPNLVIQLFFIICVFSCLDFLQRCIINKQQHGFNFNHIVTMNIQQAKIQISSAVS